MADVRNVTVLRRLASEARGEVMSLVSYVPEEFQTDFQFEWAHDMLAFTDLNGDLIHHSYVGKTNLVFRDSTGRIQHVYPGDRVVLNQ